MLGKPKFNRGDKVRFKVVDKEKVGFIEIVDKLANDAYEKASGKKITDFGRIKTDKEYRNQVFKNSKENERNKMIAEVIMSVINDERPKTIDYVQSIVEEINYIFRTIK